MLNKTNIFLIMHFNPAYFIIILWLNDTSFLVDYNIREIRKMMRKQSKKLPKKLIGKKQRRRRGGGEGGRRWRTGRKRGQVEGWRGGRYRGAEESDRMCRIGHKRNLYAAPQAMHLSLIHI